MRTHLLLSAALCLFFYTSVQAEDESTQNTSVQGETVVVTTQEVDSTETTTPTKETSSEPTQEVNTTPAKEPESAPVPVQTVDSKPAGDVQTQEQEEVKQENPDSKIKQDTAITREVVHPDYRLKHIVNQGASLFLNDYSGWSVSSKYRETAAQWQKGDSIRLIYEQVNWFVYKVELRNLNRNESVFGTLKEVPNVLSPDALLIESISDNSTHLRLNDGTLLHALGTWELKHSGWKPGDLVTFLYWGELDGKPACAVWNHDSNAIIGEMMLIEYVPVNK